MKRTWPVLFGLLLLMLSGCATPPPAGTPESVAPQAGGAPRAEPDPVLTASPIGLDPFRVPGEGGPLQTYGLYLAEAVTGRLLYLSRTPYAGLSWSRDGRVAVQVQSETDALDVLDIPAGKGIRLSGGDPWEAVVSPDGRLIAFSRWRMTSSQSQVFGLYLVGTNGTGLRTITREEGVGRLTWSPGSDRLAFQVTGGDPQGEVRVLDIATGQVTAVGNAPFGAFDWSPDGKGLALGTPSGITLLPMGGGAPREISRPSRDGQVPLWSPDGAWFAFYEYHPERPGWSLMTFRSDGSGAPQTLAEVMPGAEWSPDGTRLAYISFGCESHDFGLFTVKPDGSDRRRLDGPGPGPVRLTPVWSPDGKAIASAQVKRVVLTDAATGEERVLVKDESVYWLALLRGWSPDGRYIAFANGVGKGVCD